MTCPGFYHPQFGIILSLWDITMAKDVKKQACFSFKIFVVLR